MVQEMCEVQSELLGNPREFWTYRDESFMGVVSSMAHSRGQRRFRRFLSACWTPRALALMIGCERAIGKKNKKLDTEQTHLRHTPHDTNTKGS